MQSGTTPAGGAGGTTSMYMHQWRVKTPRRRTCEFQTSLAAGAQASAWLRLWCRRMPFGSHPSKLWCCLPCLHPHGFASQLHQGRTGCPPPPHPALPSA